MWLPVNDLLMKRTEPFQPDNNEEDSDELFDKLLDKFLNDELDLDDAIPERESESVDENNDDDDDEDLTDELLNLFENGTNDEKIYCAKYFSYPSYFSLLYNLYKQSVVLNST